MYSGALSILVHRNYFQSFLWPQSTPFCWHNHGLWNSSIILDCFQSSAIYKPWITLYTCHSYSRRCICGIESCKWDCIVKGWVHLECLKDIDKFLLLGFVPYFTHTSHMWACLFPSSITHRIHCQIFGFFAGRWKMVFSWSFNLYIFCYKWSWASFYSFKYHFIFIFMWTVFWTLYIFLYVVGLFFFIPKSFSYTVCDELQIFFPSWSCMLWFPYGGFFCPWKVCLILCNQIYLFVYAFYILSQN